MARRLELITDFSVLKAGDRVFILMCDHCGASHEGTTVSYSSNAPGQQPQGLGIYFDSVWITDCICDGLPAGINPGCVEANRVYLVKEGLEQTETTEKAESRPLETVR